jgi:hypothetical protein
MLTLTCVKNAFNKNNQLPTTDLSLNCCLFWTIATIHHGFLKGKKAALEAWHSGFAFASRTEVSRFESRQGERFFGFYTLLLPKLNLYFHCVYLRKYVI